MPAGDALECFLYARLASNGGRTAILPMWRWRCQEAKLSAGISLQFHDLSIRQERFRKNGSNPISAWRKPPQLKPAVLLRHDCLTAGWAFNQNLYSSKVADDLASSFGIQLFDHSLDTRSVRRVGP